MFPDMMWIAVKDGDERAFSIFKRHYSFHDYKDGRRRDRSNPNRFLIAGPGRKLVLMTLQCDALFVWRVFHSDDGQEGINCAVFRNESPHLASEMILEAEKLAWAKWPDMNRMYTYVNGAAVASSNPGYCFKKAGWQKCGVTKTNKLIILEKYREDNKHESPELR